ncbi:MAG: hypothetical protein OYH77_08945 [Pseudomonadota bacterium]|nr:hypothetical protein [Pseudomonadota bacterium]
MSLFFRRSACVLGLLFIILIMSNVSVEIADARPNPSYRFNLTHADSHLIYREHGTVNLRITNNHYKKFSVLAWEVVESQLPPGLTMRHFPRPGGTSRVGHTMALAGEPLFIGEWCFNFGLTIRVAPSPRRSPRRPSPTPLRYVMREVCLNAKPNPDYRRVVYRTNQHLPTAVKDQSYGERVMYGGLRSGRGVRVRVVWHDLPSSLMVDRLSRRQAGFVISGTPTDRHKYRIPNHSDVEPVKLGEFHTLKKMLSLFFHRVPVKYHYRITAVYPYAGETRSNFVRIINVVRGDIVKGRLSYQSVDGYKPMYLNVFRGKAGSGEYRLIERLQPSLPSGATYVIDSNRMRPRTLNAAGNYHVNVKISSERDLVAYQQLSLRVSGGEHRPIPHDFENVPY